MNFFLQGAGLLNLVFDALELAPVLIALAQQGGLALLGGFNQVDSMGGLGVLNAIVPALNVLGRGQDAVLELLFTTFEITQQANGILLLAAQLVF